MNENKQMQFWQLLRLSIILLLCFDVLIFLFPSVIFPELTKYSTWTIIIAFNLMILTNIIPFLLAFKIMDVIFSYLEKRKPEKLKNNKEFKKKEHDEK